MTRKEMQLILGALVLATVSTVSADRLMSLRDLSDPDAPKQATGFVTTDNYANPQLGYYYYIPPMVLKGRSAPHDVLVCVPGLSGSGQGFVDDKMKRLADQENFVIVAPSFMFDSTNWNAERSYQFPVAWSGAAFLQILDKLKSDEGLSFSKLYLYGVSAGAQFVLRFSLLHPELCAACVAHASGGLVIPAVKNSVKYFIGIGKNDSKDRLRLAQMFLSAAYGLGMDVTYREYNEGHGVVPEQEVESLDFIKRVHHSLQTSGEIKR